MLIYIFALMLLYCTSIVNPRKIGKVDVIFFVLLTLASGLRFGVGTDFFNYNRYYNLIESGYKVAAEPGFIYLSLIISKFNFNSQALFLTLSTLTMFFLFKGIKYYTNNEYTFKPVLYIIFLIFTYFTSFNGVRQALAAAILFYASKYIVEKSLWKFSVWIVFSMLFHSSSVIFFGLYFIATRDFNRIILLLGIFFSFMLSNLGIIAGFIEYIFLNYSFLDIGGYLENYLYSSYNSREVSYGIVFYINVGVLILFIIMKDHFNKSQKAQLAFNFFYLYNLIYILSMDAPMLTRLTYFFSIYMAISIPRFGLMFNKKTKRLVEYILVALYSLLFLYVIINGYLNPGQTDYIPYDYNIDFFK
jgi:transmembrane protein EpsG